MVKIVSEDGDAGTIFLRLLFAESSARSFIHVILARIFKWFIVSEKNIPEALSDVCSSHSKLATEASSKMSRKSSDISN